MATDVLYGCREAYRLSTLEATIIIGSRIIDSGLDEVNLRFCPFIIEGNVICEDPRIAVPTSAPV